jgi:exopolyphosphatase/guanosine-5'-triphosphate,3'-diphosphate pyrophosphatase
MILSAIWGKINNMSSDVTESFHYPHPLKTSVSASDIPHDASRIGLIDIGSNSIRLVIYRSDGRLPHPQFNEREVCRLGEEVGRSGYMDEQQMAQAFRTLQRFAAIVHASKVTALEVFATEAVRRAHNSADFITRAETILNARIRVISGKEEAAMSALGVCSGFLDPAGLVADLGGGSLELVPVSSGKTIHSDRAVSVPCGYLINNSEDSILSSLQSVPWLGSMVGQRFYAVGGVWRAIATAFSYQLKPRIDIVHGLSISLDQLHVMMDRIEACDGDMYGIPSARRFSMAQAIRITRILIGIVKPGEIIFSAFGVREGILSERLDLHSRHGDPLIDGVKEYGAMTMRFSDQGKHIAKIMEIFMEYLPPSYHRLVRACCYLCDLAWLEHPDHRSRLVLEKMLGLSVVGINHMERVWMAAVLYTRYEGNMPKNKDFLAFIPHVDRKFARSTGLLLRLLMTFSGGIPDLLKQIRIEPSETGFTITIAEHLIGSGDLVKRRVSSANRSLPYKIRLG